MRSRSSRLFVVLLHLVGVSTNLPQHARHGIVGVHPLSILLEPLELQAAGGLGELLALLEGAGYDVDKTVLHEPYWLQDDVDGTCLGPSGFSECGDATLWKIRRRYSSKRSRHGRKRPNNSSIEIKDIPESKGFFAFLKSSSGSVQEDLSWEYALELVDVNAMHQQDTDIDSIDDLQSKECIISISPSGSDLNRGALEMGSCESDDAWSWSITEGGVLRWEPHYYSSPENERENDAKIALGGPMARFLDITSRSLSYSAIYGSNDESTAVSHNAAQCIWRNRDSNAVTAPCQGPTSNESHELVSFSVIQYQNSAAKSPQLPRFPRIEVPGLHTDSTMKSYDRDSDNNHLPHVKRTSQAAGLNLKTDSSQDTSNPSAPPASEYSDIKSPFLGVGGHFERRMHQTKPAMEKNGGTNIIHNTASPRSSNLGSDDTPYKIRKMPIHPYIAASKDGWFEDPQTGLKFPTDISEYLGHDRQVTGRHTLTGLGVYTRTMLKIKIYSVAFYVAKREILAGKAFDRFAFKTADDLRTDDEFFNRLMTMGSNPDEGNFDRTLFIKLNMQLSTETVRQSLTGEWSLLTDELKDLLYASSAKVREADARMLETIKSSENSSNCSCGQTAPPEYAADPTCCARGTEMVFTWRKSGCMELRIDGRLIDEFSQPDIAPGIFYEYLRGDDPISMEARNSFADGFPFLLAPLAQLKGFVSRQETATETDESPPKKSQNGRNWNKLVASVWDHLQSKTTEVVSWTRDNVDGGIHNMNNAIHGVNSALQNFGSTWNNLTVALEEKREEALENMSQLNVKTFKMLLSRIPILNDKFIFEEESVDHEEEHGNVDIISNKRNVFQPLIVEMLERSSQQRPETDEIGVIIEPSMSSTHLLFLYSVHLYLVLLLILSVPDSHTTRLVIKKSSVYTLDSESDNEERCLQLEGSVNDPACSFDDRDTEWNKAIPRFVVERNGIERNVDVLSDDDIDSDENTIEHAKCSRSIPKALSYFL